MQAIIKKITVFLSLALYLGAIFGGSAMAQSNNETEAAAESHLLQVMLPGGAQRILPESIPTEITQTLEKVIVGSGGKFRQGDTEVLLWGGGNYKKSNAGGIVNRLTGSLKTAGWQYSIEGGENGITVFSALQQSPRRRAVVGFYGATDEALILAAMEIVPTDRNDAPTNAADERTESETSTGNVEKPGAKQNSTGRGGLIVGTWYDGYVSLVGVAPTVGPRLYTPGRSHRFEYVFHPNGTYTYTGIMNNTVYSCTTTIFNDQRGTYKINGDQITLTKTKNFFRRTDTCSAANFLEKNHTLGSETYTFSVSRNERGKEQVCFTSGENTPCYERAQK